MPQYREFNIAAYAGNWVETKVLASALNHRDLWICKRKYPGLDLPVVLGSDACVGYNEKEYLLLPAIGWGNDERFQAADYTIFGASIHGTFAQHMYVPEDNLFEKPAHLDPCEAAALTLSGITAYRALFQKGNAKPGESVFINGIGGGVALTAMQFAIEAGTKVWVSSSSRKKIDMAIRLGAMGGIEYTSETWAKDLIKRAGKFDLILDSAGGSGFPNLIRIAAPSARIVVYGGHKGKINALSPQQLFWKQISILGTSMGSPADFKEMIDFVEKNKIRPYLDRKYSLDQFSKAFERMDKGQQFGKIVFDHLIKVKW